LPFIDSPPLYSGPVARAMGGIDISWIIGLAVTSPAYYWLAKRSQGAKAANLVRPFIQDEAIKSHDTTGP
jgi:NCS1 family nucleobase:cation symporter-1